MLPERVGQKIGGKLKGWWKALLGMTTGKRKRSRGNHQDAFGLLPCHYASLSHSDSQRQQEVEE